MPVLPPRPLRVKASYFAYAGGGGGALLLLAAAIAVAGSLWQFDAARTIVRDRDLWQRGTPSEGGSVSGQSTSHKLILNSYKLDAVYPDADGREHRGRVEFDTLFVSVDQNHPPELRYDPADPDRFVLSWAVETTIWRWAAVAFLWLALLGLAGACAWGGGQALRNLGDARACATASDELELEVLAVADVVYQGKPTGAHKYTLRLPPGSFRNSLEVTIPNKRTALAADASGKCVIALRSPQVPDRPVVLRDDLHPFAFRPEEEKTIRQRIADAGRG